MTADLMATPMGGYLQTTYSYLSMTKRSPVPDRARARRPARFAGQHPARRAEISYLSFLEDALLVSVAGRGAPTPDERAHSGWPSLSARQTEHHLLLRHRRPGIRSGVLKPTIRRFLDLVQQLRETEISPYTLRDTPIFTCIRMTPKICWRGSANHR